MSSEATRFRLRRFDPVFAGPVVSWVRDESELFLLAPSTKPPLTPAKLIDWTRARGTALTLFEAGKPLPCAYGELNPMKRDAGHLWLGHILVDSDRRGQGIGGVMIRSMVTWAVDQHRARRLTLVVFPENQAAIHCYEKNGFRYSGEEFQCFRGQRQYRLLRFEYPTAQTKARPDRHAHASSPTTLECDSPPDRAVPARATA